MQVDATHAYYINVLNGLGLEANFGIPAEISVLEPGTEAPDTIDSSILPKGLGSQRHAVRAAEVSINPKP